MRDKLLDDLKDSDSKIPCLICGKNFLTTDLEIDTIAIDHCHFSGKINGLVHYSCNRDNNRIQGKFPIFFHNFGKYDSKLILNALTSSKLKGLFEIEVFSKNSENLRTITIIDVHTGVKFHCMDSLSHLNTSLKTLVDNLNSSNHEFNILKQSDIVLNSNNEFDESKFEILRVGKGVIAYDYLTSYSKISNMTSLPKKEEFFSVLSNSHISDSDFEFAELYWDTFKFKTYKENVLTYCVQDVLLLAEVVLKYRTVIFNQFKIDPCRYIGLPAVSFDIFLKSLSLSKVKLDFIPNAEMHSFFRRAIRGGVSYIDTHHAFGCDDMQKKKSDFLIYLDVNSLYPAVMTRKLPTGGYQFMGKNSIDSLMADNQKNIHNYNEKGNWGCFLECDLTYPKSLHNRTNNMILAPYTRSVERNDLSEESLKALHIINPRRNLNNFSEKKLIADFNPRKKYVLHISVLKTYLKMGMVLEKIHSGVEFKQANFLSDHIHCLSNLRSNATTKFDKDMYKLLSNSIYGKFIQNPYLYHRTEFFSSQLDPDISKKVLKRTSSPYFKSIMPIGTSAVLVDSLPPILKMNQIVSIGATILDYSKQFMYQMYYANLEPHWGFGNIDIVMSDTDSFLLKVFSKESLEKDYFKLSRILDFSKFPKDHPLKKANTVKANALGYLKDEQNGVSQITEVIGLQSKCYSYISQSTVKKVKKGFPRRWHSDLNFSLYKKVLQKGKVMRKTSVSIGSKKQVLRTYRKHALTLTNLDTKRYILDCKVHSYGFGHKNISLFKGKCLKCN